MPVPLPIDPHVADIVATVAARRCAIVVAPPGTGKTTRLAPALTALGRVILLQPRRIAARAIARRIAEEQGLALGEGVGYQVRLERRFGPHTRLLVATEGILTARLQADPLLSDFAVVVLDEVHERSLHGDLALALARQAQLARGDLAIVAMSATLDAGPLARFLGDAPVIRIAAAAHPLDIRHAPGLDLAGAVQEVLGRDGGHVLCFLAGAPEIRRAGEEIARALGRDVARIRLLPLHGSLDADRQDEALAPSALRKVILATNLAETSLTVDGVSEVIDGGFHKVMRYQPDTGIDRLVTERIAADSAAQRAGRAGRTGPGRCVRLWDAGLRLRPAREPEIARVDLAPALLEILAWGGDPRHFAWLEPPPPDRVAAALALLESLGAVASGRLTPLGDELRRFPLHPRLARVLVAAGGSPRAAAVVATVAEGYRAAGDVTTDSDVLAAADRISAAPHAVRATARELADLARRTLARPAATSTDEDILRALLGGYPDRVAWRRDPGSPRLLLASGRGARLARESGVRDGELLVAIEVTEDAAGGGEALVRVASRIERAWLVPTGSELLHELDASGRRVLAWREERYGAIPVGRRPGTPDPITARALLVAELRRRGLGEENEALLRRLRFAGLAVDPDAMLERACAGGELPRALDLAALLPPAARHDLERLAPAALTVPSGRRLRLEYRDDGSVVLAVKLQELFGLADTPRIGPRRERVLLSLLSPGGRPVQTTRDLKSFWERTYPEVRGELRGRYPRHPWPEDPASAPPTARTTPRRRQGV